MPHCMIIEKIKNMPKHWQDVFQELRIVYGMENAYYKICELRKENAYV